MRRLADLWVVVSSEIVSLVIKEDHNELILVSLLLCRCWKTMTPTCCSLPPPSDYVKIEDSNHPSTT